MARYLERRDTDVAELRRALLQTDFEKIRITGHNLFGSGSAYGLDEISRLGEAIETAAKAADSERLDHLIAELTHYLQTLTVR